MLKISNVDVGAAITNLQSGFGNLTVSDITLKNVICTSLTSTGNITGNDVTANGNITSTNSFYGGQNGFSIRCKNGAAGLLLYGDGSLRCDVNLTVVGSASCNTVPSAVSHLCRKDYVDALSYLVAGGGLTKTSSTLSVNAAQPGITSVGTLTSLTTGAITGTSATFSSPITVATPTLTGHATTKAYTDGLSYLTAGVGLTKTGSTLSVNAGQSQITQVGTLTSLSLSGQIVSNLVAAVSGTTYSSSFLLADGYGLIVSGGITQGVGSVAKLEMKNGASVTPICLVDGGGNATFSLPITVATPTLTGHATTKGYTDALSYLTAGVGLTKTSATLSVNASQSQITSVGTLGSLDVSGAANVGSLTTSGAVNAGNVRAGGMLYADNSIQGGGNGFLISPQGAFSAFGLLVFGGGECRCTATTQSTSTSSGALTVLGGAGIAGNLYGSNAVFSGTVTASTVPSAAGHLTNKSYVDGAITSANANVSSGVLTSGTFTISGLSFVGLSKSVRWSKIGSACMVSAEMSWTSTTGTLVEADGNTTISTPFNSPIVRSMNVVIQKDSFVTTKMSYMDEASPALKTRVDSGNMPGYATGATLLFSWIFYT